MTTTDTPPAAEAAEPVTPLEMALDWAQLVHQIAARYAEREREEPGMGKIEAHINGAGRHQLEAAQMASYMALVSLADDIHAIRRIMLGQADPDAKEPEPTPEEVADAETAWSAAEGADD